MSKLIEICPIFYDSNNTPVIDTSNRFFMLGKPPVGSSFNIITDRKAFISASAAQRVGAAVNYINSLSADLRIPPPTLILFESRNPDAYEFGCYYAEVTHALTMPLSKFTDSCFSRKEFDHKKNIRHEMAHGRQYFEKTGMLYCDAEKLKGFMSCAVPARISFSEYTLTPCERDAREYACDNNRIELFGERLRVLDAEAKQFMLRSLRKIPALKAAHNRTLDERCNVYLEELQDTFIIANEESLSLNLSPPQKAAVRLALGKIKGRRLNEPHYVIASKAHKGKLF